MSKPRELTITRGILYEWWSFPGSESTESGYSTPVLNPINFSGYTPVCKIYDREPETWTETINLLLTPSVTLYDNASTNEAFMEAREDALTGVNLGTNEIEDFDGFLFSAAAADTKHDVSAINTALAAEYEPVWGAEATSGTTVRFIGGGKVKFLPDPVRT